MGGRHCFLGSVAKPATVLRSQNSDSLQFLKLSREILRNLSPHRLLLSGTRSIIKYPTAWPQNTPREAGRSAPTEFCDKLAFTTPRILSHSELQAPYTAVMSSGFRT